MGPGFCEELIKISQTQIEPADQLPGKVRALNAAKMVAVPAAGAGIGLGAGTLARHLIQKQYGSKLTPLARKGARYGVPAVLALAGGLAAKGLAKSRQDAKRELEEKALAELAEKK